MHESGRKAVSPVPGIMVCDDGEIQVSLAEFVAAFNKHSILGSEPLTVPDDKEGQKILCGDIVKGFLAYDRPDIVSCTIVGDLCLHCDRYHVRLTNLVLVNPGDN